MYRKQGYIVLVVKFATKNKKTQTFSIFVKLYKVNRGHSLNPNFNGVFFIEFLKFNLNWNILLVHNFLG